MLAIKFRAYPSGAPERWLTLGYSVKGKLLVLPTNIRLSWKGLPGTNTVAHYEDAWITDKKVYIGLVPDRLPVHGVANTFFGVICVNIGVILTKWKGFSNDAKKFYKIGPWSDRIWRKLIFWFWNKSENNLLLVIE